MKPYIFLFLFLSSIFAQGVKHPITKSINCKTCHTCEYPTTKDPCLADCPRENLITIRHSAQSGPEFIKLDYFKGRYEPVNFSHRLHAEMYEMSGGCGGCHHYNTSGPVLKCNTCHLPKEEKTDLSVPGLQAVFHRQCISCHRTWSHDDGCESCHQGKGKQKRHGQEISKTVHKPIESPVKKIYQTSYEKGAVVTFYHNDHTKLFGLNCANCHNDQSCVNCHDKNAKTKKAVVINLTEEEKHKACFSCHKNDACSKCHTTEKKLPFDHFASAGWSLKDYHSGISCKGCHSDFKVKFGTHECSTCHTGWNSSNFNHRITGLILDSDHSEFECSDCHTGKKFTTTPSCSTCHDDKSFPKDKPGKSIW